MARARGVAVVLVLGVLGGRAFGDADGDRLLAQVDQALDRAQTQSIEYRVVTGKPPGGERALALEARLKSGKWRFEFTAPEDLKGTRLLVLSTGERYVVLPAFGNRVRRIAANADRSFMELAYGVAELRLRWGDDYSAAIASQTASQLELTLTPKEGRSPLYAKVKLTIDKKLMLPTRIESFDAAGARSKTETRAGYSCQGEVCTAAEHKLVDHVTQATTTLTRGKWTANAPIDDEVFTVRGLAQ